MLVQSVQDATAHARTVVDCDDVMLGHVQRVSDAELDRVREVDLYGPRAVFIGSIVHVHDCSLLVI